MKMWRALSVTAVLVPWIGSAAWVGAEPPDLVGMEGDLGQVLDVTGMTFVASEGSANEILLRAKTALFYPEREIAELVDVDVQVAPGEDRLGFVMRCDEGRLNLAAKYRAERFARLADIPGSRWSPIHRDVRGTPLRGTHKEKHQVEYVGP